MKKWCKGGFTLVETVVSVAMLAVITAGFMMMTGGNAQILGSGYRTGQAGYELGQMAENQNGSRTGVVDTLFFEDTENRISGRLDLYEYEVSTEGLAMYYYDRQ